jgi:hypothetical protein
MSAANVKMQNQIAREGTAPSRAIFIFDRPHPMRHQRDGQRMGLKEIRGSEMKNFRIRQNPEIPFNISLIPNV